jgi:hypothetical protein
LQAPEPTASFPTFNPEQGYSPRPNNDPNDPMNDLPNRELAKTALTRTLGFSALVGLLVIVPAGTGYWQGWLYWIVFSLCSLAVTLYFLRHDPALVERRLRARTEKEESQKVIRALRSVVLILLYVLPGIDHRFGWSHVPAFVVAIADAVVVLGFAIIFMTFKANSHAAAIIDVAPGQRVVSTGPMRWSAIQCTWVPRFCFWRPLSDSVPYGRSFWQSLP